jgi:hypothetical protein
LLGDFNSRIADDPDFIEIFINEHELDFTQFVENELDINYTKDEVITQVKQF